MTQATIAHQSQAADQSQAKQVTNKFNFKISCKAVEMVADQTGNRLLEESKVGSSPMQTQGLLDVRSTKYKDINSFSDEPPLKQQTDRGVSSVTETGKATRAMAEQAQSSRESRTSTNIEIPDDLCIFTEPNGEI